ncbi:MAG: DUF6547 family protein [Pseudomonadota bacterium]
MATPLNAYKKLIDSVAAISDDDTQANRIDDNRQSTDPASDESLLIDRLSAEERATLIEMLKRSRRSGIHDTLAQLNELILLDGLRLVSSGAELPVEPFGSGLFFDWECRRNGDDWPEPEES